MEHLDFLQLPIIPQRPTMANAAPQHINIIFVLVYHSNGVYCQKSSYLVDNCTIPTTRTAMPIINVKNVDTYI